jgi:hypothetical protein
MIAAAATLRPADVDAAEVRHGALRIGELCLSVQGDQAEAEATLARVLDALREHYLPDPRDMPMTAEAAGEDRTLRGGGDVARR